MNGPHDRLARAFETALRANLARGDESTMHAAYELGRGALECGLGVLDTVGALSRALLKIAAAEGGVRSRFPAAAAESFVLEALSPLEMAHRGAREANQALRQVDEVRERELRRIAHDLHDSAGQMFTPVHLALAELAGRADPETAKELARVRALLVRGEEQMRRLAHEFRPPILDDLGLRAAIAELAESVRSRTGIAVDVRGDVPEQLPPRVGIALYRGAQEAFNNAVRHAGASRIAVHFECTDRSLRCLIEDDGSGFEPAAHPSPSAGGGLGLRGICERAAALGGSLVVISAPGRGTRLQLDIPLEASLADARPDRR